MIVDEGVESDNRLGAFDGKLSLCPKFCFSFSFFLSKINELPLDDCGVSASR
jgi:hypothetical protein